ncbi:hypothetical protein J6R97_03740 [bacterium]|nr:hypothetical protein [bacterium]
MTQVSQFQPSNQYQNNNYRKANYGGALVSAGMGGATWLAIHYMFNKRPYLDKNTDMLSDSFVASVKDGLDIKTETLPDYTKLEKKIEGLTKEGLDDFLKDNKLDCDKSIKDLFGNVETIEEGKTKLKEVAKNDCEKSHVRELYDKCCNEKGKLVYTEGKIDIKQFNVIKKIANKFRRNSALLSAAILTGMSASLMCMIEFFVGRKAKKMEQQ